MQNNYASRRYRVVTALEKRQAQIMAACGLSVPQIGRSLSRSPSVVRNWLVMGESEKTRQRAKRNREQDPEKIKNQAKKYRENNKKRVHELQRQWREKNVKKIKNKWKLYYLKNCELLRKKAQEYREKNRSKVEAARKKFQEKNKERRNQRARELRAKNPEARRHATREWRKRNPEMASESSKRSRAIRRAAGHRAIVKISAQQLKERFELFGCACAYCGAKKDITIDHVLPIKLGGLHEINNIAPACFRCNCSKNCKPVEEWYRSQNFFNELKWKKIKKFCAAACALQLSFSVCN